MTLRNIASILSLSLLLVYVYCDTYFHAPRGTNNRLNERSANRRTGNRVFDSQNNNRGGYNVGDKTDKSARSASAQYSMSYFTSGKVGKSFFPMEWTNQHGCGQNTPDDPIKVICQIVLQYTCQPDDGSAETRTGPTRETIRDGTNTARNGYQKPLPDGRNGKLSESSSYYTRRSSGNNKQQSGMNEPYAWRDKCEARPRNKGLFTADQKIKNDAATSTRQNPNGNRNGYECAEERDYYPYWHPSDWKDIAVLVEDKSRCTELQKNSFNVKPYHECVEEFSDGEEAHYSRAETARKCAERSGEWREYHNYLEKLEDPADNGDMTQAKCNALATNKGLTSNEVIFGFAIYGKEKECLVKLKEPDCKLGNYTRVNHLGNANGDALKTSQYNWELPRFPSGEKQRCVVRLRYNISTADYPATTDSASNNKKDVISQNPQVPVGLDNGQTLRLAINTAQFGRTFQDRSHVFYLKGRKDASIDDKPNLYNLNVRGKRGNIVQTYPAVEYDFVPKDLKVTKEDLVHVQWTGSNSHNNGNPAGDGQAGDDGEGKGGTDRSNMMDLADSGKNFFTPMESTNNIAHNVDVLWAAKTVTNPSPYDIALQLASAGKYSCYDCSNADSFKTLSKTRNKMDKLLNNAPASFGGMVLKFKNKGKYVYGCTRNNNFSNRSQKGQILVK